MSDSQTSDKVLGQLKPQAICHQCKGPVSIRWVNGEWELRHHETWSYEEGKKVCSGTETPTTHQAIDAWIKTLVDEINRDQQEVDRAYQKQQHRLEENRTSIQEVQNIIRQSGGKRA